MHEGETSKFGYATFSKSIKKRHTKKSNPGKAKRGVPYAFACPIRSVNYYVLGKTISRIGLIYGSYDPIFPGCEKLEKYGFQYFKDVRN